MKQDKLAEALRDIKQIANAALDSTDHVNKEIACVPKSVPKRFLEDAAKNAISINSQNAITPMSMALRRQKSIDKLAIAISIAKYWGPAPRTLTVSFMESTSNGLANRIIGHMNSWRCGVKFAFTDQIGDVRISRGGGGYWSYLGTDVTLIPQDRQTMNLESFTMNTPDAEFYRVVRHETGHTLGMPHEHMRSDIIARINREKAYAYFWQSQRWDRATVDQQVLTSLDEASIFGTPPDETSIMCYQLPGTITEDGNQIVGGLDINDTDRLFAQEKYPESEDDANDSMDDHDCIEDDFASPMDQAY